MNGVAGAASTGRHSGHGAPRHTPGGYCHSSCAALPQAPVNPLGSAAAQGVRDTTQQCKVSVSDAATTLYRHQQSMSSLLLPDHGTRQLKTGLCRYPEPCIAALHDAPPHPHTHPLGPGSTPVISNHQRTPLDPALSSCHCPPFGIPAHFCPLVLLQMP